MAPIIVGAVVGASPDARVMLAWGVVTGAVTYEVSRSMDGSAWVLGDPAVVDGAVTTQTGLSSGTTVLFQVRALGPGGLDLGQPSVPVSVPVP